MTITYSSNDTKLLLNGYFDSLNNLFKLTGFNLANNQIINISKHVNEAGNYLYNVNGDTIYCIDEDTTSNSELMVFSVNPGASIYVKSVRLNK